MVNEKLFSNLTIIPEHQQEQALLHHPRCSQSLQQIQDFGINYDRNGSCRSLHSHQQMIHGDNKHQRKRNCYSESDKSSTALIIPRRSEYEGNDQIVNINSHGLDDEDPTGKFSNFLSRCYTLRHYIACVFLVALVGATLCVALISSSDSSITGGPVDPEEAQFKKSPVVTRDVNSGNRKKLFIPNQDELPPSSLPLTSDTGRSIFSNDKKQKTMMTTTKKIIMKSRTTTMIPQIHPYHHSLVSSAADLSKIGSQCETVTVKMLKEKYTPPRRSASPASLNNVKILNIVGPVTEDWLGHLLRRFDRIENLTIDAYELCRAATKMNKNSLATLSLDSVRSLRVQNSRLCSISSWIFTWDMPNIRHLSIYDSDLQREVYDPIHQFFEKNKDTLSTVIISHSYLCDDCIYTDVRFKELKQFSISEQVAEPWLDDEDTLTEEDED